MSRSAGEMELMTLSATEKRKRPVQAKGLCPFASQPQAADRPGGRADAVRLRRQAAAAGRGRRRRRSRWRSRSNAPSPIGMNSPAASRRSRRCRSAPASAASSPVVEFRDGAFVHAGDLLYVIDPRPFEAVALQADGQLSDARAKAELAKRELDRALTLVQTRPSPNPSSTSAARPCRRRMPPRCRPKAR